jgi:hypothetical protein
LLHAENLVYHKKRSEDRVNDPRLPVRSGSLPQCPEARERYFLILTYIDPKVLRTLRPRGATLTDHVCAPSNGIQAAVYDSIGPTIVDHDRQ